MRFKNKQNFSNNQNVQIGKFEFFKNIEITFKILLIFDIKR